MRRVGLKKEGAEFYFPLHPLTFRKNWLKLGIEYKVIGAL